MTSANKYWWGHLKTMYYTRWKKWLWSAKITPRYHLRYMHYAFMSEYSSDPAYFEISCRFRTIISLYVYVEYFFSSAKWPHCLTHYWWILNCVHCPSGEINMAVHSENSPHTCSHFLELCYARSSGEEMFTACGSDAGILWIALVPFRSSSGHGNVE